MRIPKTMVLQKGQIGTMDATIATIMVIATMTTTLSYSMILINHSKNTHTQLQKDRALYEATEILITTQGAPTDWHEKERDIERIGLAKYSQKTVQNHHLDPEKVMQLEEMTLDQINQKLGVGHDLSHLKIESIDNHKVLEKKIQKTKDQTERKIKRIALLEGKIHTIKAGVIE